MGNQLGTVPVRKEKDTAYIKNQLNLNKIMKQFRRDKQRVSEIRRSSWGFETNYVRDIRNIERSELALENYLNVKVAGEAG